MCESKLFSYVKIMEIRIINKKKQFYRRLGYTGAYNGSKNYKSLCPNVINRLHACDCLSITSIQVHPQNLLKKNQLLPERSITSIFIFNMLIYSKSIPITALLFLEAKMWFKIVFLVLDNFVSRANHTRLITTDVLNSDHRSKYN